MRRPAASATLEPVNKRNPIDDVETSAAAYSLSASVVIPPGMTTADVPVTVVADQDTDAGETLELSLTNVQNAAVGLPFTTVLTIRPEGEIFFNGFESGN